MNKYNIGTFVETKKHNYKGRITDIHSKCPMSPVQIDHQNIPLTEEELKGIWYSILCEPAGVVWVSESDIKKVEPFLFTNIWKDDYFN